MDVNLGVFEVIQLAVQHLSTQDSLTVRLLPPGPLPLPQEAGIIPEIVLTGLLQPPQVVKQGTIALGAQYEVILRPVAPVGQRS
jgi:hypothetical protein